MIASQNDRNSGQEYFPSKVVSLVNDNANYVDEIFDEAYATLKAMA